MYVSGFRARAKAKARAHLVLPSANVAFGQEMVGVSVKQEPYYEESNHDMGRLVTA